MMETDRHGAIQLTQSVFMALFLFYSVLFIVLWEYYSFILVDKMLFVMRVSNLLKLWFLTPLHSNQGVESQPPLGFRANQRPPVHGWETANSLEKLQHGRKHLCDGLHGEELVTAWRERGQGLIRNGDARLNSSHYWTLEAAADGKGPTKVWTLVLHSFTFETSPYHRKRTFYSRRFFF